MSETAANRPAMVGAPMAAAAQPARGSSLHFGHEARPGICTLVRPVPSQPPLHQSLTAAGYYVWRASSAAEAISAVLREPAIGILVCDHMLPTGSGLAVLQSLRAKLPEQRVLAPIFMAEAVSINDVIGAFRAGALDFLGSRLPPEHVVEAIRRAEAVVRARSQARLVATQASRLAEAAVDLARRANETAAEPLLPRPIQPAAGLSADSRQLEIGQESIHARSLKERRQRQLTAALKAQQARQRGFGELATNSAAWAMLLDLYDKLMRNQQVSVSSLCLASGAPTSTALRRLEELVESGLVLREKDVEDARRTLVRLTPEAIERLNNYLDATL